MYDVVCIKSNALWLADSVACSTALCTSICKFFLFFFVFVILHRQSKTRDKSLLIYNVNTYLYVNKIIMYLSEKE